MTASKSKGKSPKASPSKAPAKVEEVSPVDSVEDIPDLDNVQDDDDEGGDDESSTLRGVPENIGVPADIDPATLQRAAQLVRDQTRGEKKARKVFEGLGLMALDGITRVVFCRPRNELIVIAEPEVYKSVNGDVYIVYGIASMANGNLGPTALAAKRMAQRQMAAAAAAAGAGGAGAQPHVHSDACNHGDEAGNDDPADELPEGMANVSVSGKGKQKATATGAKKGSSSKSFPEEDIVLVTRQSGASRAEAIKALEANDGDTVNAIMDLTA